MSDFDDFGLGGNMGGVMPRPEKSLPTDLRNSRSFFGNSSNIPKFYYDFQAQARHYAHRRLRSRTKS